MINISNKGKCCGCHGCASACLVGCISMEPDQEGFMYPHIDKSQCIDCGICEKICPMAKNYELLSEPTAYACYSLDENIQGASSSGGVFSEIARWVIESNGVVFGAAFDEKFNVRHIWVDNLKDLEKLRGSKYVQSDIGRAYEQVKAFLKQGRMVYFTGTPCQVAGLYSFLGEKNENLITQDIICHGVPSPAVWRKYVAYRQKKAKLCKVSFRNKENGWKQYRIFMEFEDGTIYAKDPFNDSYMHSFLTDICLRPSCYQCEFKSKSRVSDITLADFWGIEKVIPELVNDNGISLVLLHSQRGREILGSIRDRLFCQQVDVDGAICYNTSAIRSAIPHPKRDEFLVCVMNADSWKQAEVFVRVPLITQIKKVIKRVAKKVMRRK